MAWQIVPQVEKLGKLEMVVDVKHVRMFPQKDGRGNVEGFGRLGFLCLRVIIRNDKSGRELKLLLHTASGDVNNPGFTITHPDTIGKPQIVVGQGRNRRKIPDMLAADIVIPGEKEKFPYREDFEKRLKFIVGDALADEIMGKFAARLVELVGKAERRAREKATA